VKQMGRSLMMCLLALTFVVATGTALATQSFAFTGPLMAINQVEGYLVVNEVVINVDSLSDPTIVDSLTEGQWISVEVNEQGGQLQATELIIGKDPATSSGQDNN